MATKPTAKTLPKNQPAITKTAAPKAAKPVVTKPATTIPVTKPVVKPAAAPAAKKTATTVPARKTTPVPATKVAPKATVSNDKPKVAKVKMERDSFTMPKDEYAQIAALKKRLEGLGKPVKKSELLRAGLKLLSALDDTKLKAALATVPTIKTGRPKK